MTMIQPLRVAFVVKNKKRGFLRSDRAMGWFSYPVPEFTWDHICGSKGGRIDTYKLQAQGYDLIVHEDVGWRMTYRRGGIPVAFLSIDSTLSQAHYAVRYNQAKRSADLILLDHDSPDRWGGLGVPVRQCNYCVNELWFHDYEIPKNADIAYHCNSNPPGGEYRTLLRRELHHFCQERGYIYRSGSLGNPGYARSFNAARIAVNWPKTPINRPHRVFDAMACRACLLTGPIPGVRGDVVQAGKHYVTFKDEHELKARIDELLASGRWEAHANVGYAAVMKHHTWKVRATQLRRVIHETLGI